MRITIHASAMTSLKAVNCLRRVAGAQRPVVPPARQRCGGRL